MSEYQDCRLAETESEDELRDQIAEIPKRLARIRSLRFWSPENLDDTAGGVMLRLAQYAARERVGFLAAYKKASRKAIAAEIVAQRRQFCRQSAQLSSTLGGELASRPFDRLEFTEKVNELAVECGLSDTDRKFLKMRYGEGKSLDVIQESLQVESKAKVYEIHRRILNKLRAVPGVVKGILMDESQKWK